MKLASMKVERPGAMNAQQVAEAAKLFSEEGRAGDKSQAAPEPTKVASEKPSKAKVRKQTKKEATSTEADGLLVNLSVRVPADVRKRLRIKALQQGQSVQEFVLTSLLETHPDIAS